MITQTQGGWEKERAVMVFPYRPNNERQTNVITLFNLKISGGLTHYFWMLEGGETFKCHLAWRNDYVKIAPSLSYIFALCMYSVTSADRQMKFWLLFSSPSLAEPKRGMSVNSVSHWTKPVNSWSTLASASPKCRGEKGQWGTTHATPEWLVRVPLEK